MVVQCNCGCRGKRSLAKTMLGLQINRNNHLFLALTVSADADGGGISSHAWLRVSQNCRNTPLPISRKLFKVFDMPYDTPEEVAKLAIIE